MPLDIQWIETRDGNWETVAFDDCIVPGLRGFVDFTDQPAAQDGLWIATISSDDFPATWRCAGIETTREAKMIVEMEMSNIVNKRLNDEDRRRLNKARTPEEERRYEEG